MRDCPSPQFNWRDLYVIVKNSSPRTKLYAAHYPDKAEYGTQEMLLGRAVDALNWLVWSKTKDGHKNRNRPKSVLPWVKDGKENRPAGAAPKASPMSVVRRAFRNRVTDHGDRREDKINKLFGRR